MPRCEKVWLLLSSGRLVKLVASFASADAFSQLAVNDEEEEEEDLLEKVEHEICMSCKWDRGSSIHVHTCACTAIPLDDITSTATLVLYQLRYS